MGSHEQLNDANELKVLNSKTELNKKKNTLIALTMFFILFSAISSLTIVMIGSGGILESIIK